MGPHLVPNVEAVLRNCIKALESVPRDKLADPDLAERARVAVREVLGEGKVVEEDENIFAEVGLGRQYINLGAQEAVHMLRCGHRRLARAPPEGPICDSACIIRRHR